MKERNIAKVITLLLSLLSVLPMYSCGGEAQTDNTQSGVTASDESSAEEVNIPRQSRGLFIDGQSPILLATPKRRIYDYHARRQFTCHP